MSDQNPSSNSVDEVKQKMVAQLKVSTGVMVAGIMALIILSIAKAPAVGFVMLLGSFAYRIVVNLKLKKQVESNPSLAPILKEARLIALQNKKNSIFGTYQVGLDTYGLSGSYLFSVREDGLHLVKGTKEVVFRWTELVEVEAGSEGDLRKRVTASRVLLTGVFALALKKERLKDFYVSIATEESVGLFSVAVKGKKNQDLEKQTRVLTVACNSKIKSANPNRKLLAPDSAKLDEFQQVEKLGDLLLKGLITQEEFDSKKKEVLGL